MATICIRGVDPAAVLVALHTAAIPGALHGGYKNHPPIDHEEAVALLEENRRFQYVDGRALFVTIEDELEVDDFDSRNGGPGTALKALAPLIQSSDREFVEKLRDLGVPVPS